MALFQQCSVLFELKNLSIKEKKKIKSVVTDNGGTICFVANKECSLVVTSDVSSLSPGRRRNIMKHHIPVVALDYVQRCVEADRRLPLDHFTLDVSSVNDGPPASNENVTGSKVTPLKSQTKHLKVDNVESPASPKDGESVIENYKVYSETDRSLPTFPESFKVAKYSIFQKQNGRSWCLLELQSAKSVTGREYRVVRRWKDDIQSKKTTLSDGMVFVSTAEEAVKVFQALTDALKAEGLKQQRHAPLPVTEMGSAPFQQLLLEEKLHTGALSLEVGQFVELLWLEALGCINLILSTALHKISLNDVTRAEALLFQIQRKIMENSNSVLLLDEYCALLPQRSPVEASMSSVSKQFDLCQLVRDILSVSEMTSGNGVQSSVGKYRALRCSVEAVPKGSSEFEEVTSLLQHSEVQVHQILRVSRAAELQRFTREVGNIKALLHSSRPHNFVGILSRGLLMPCDAVSQHGIQRTDAGDLGTGIYFSDHIKTTLKYSQCSQTDGSRLVLVCDVALGRCKDLHQKDQTLSRAPEGHDSVHGVRKSPPLQNSEFTDDEYVVYSPDQVKLKYVVRLSVDGDELKNFCPEIVPCEEAAVSSAPQDMGEVEDALAGITNPLDAVTAGLLNDSGQKIPLQAVHVKCKLVDLMAQVVIFQKYTNDSSVPIEAKYVFPLDDSAAVCGFEAFINGKRVVGQVKEKESARREYKQAIARGHGAYLMDQDAPDVFTISVGNLPPGATVLIKVTFVSELIVKDGKIFFCLPSSVAPWQESAALNQTTQVTVEKVCVTEEGAETREFHLDMSIEMPHEITEVKCITHQVRMKKTDCKAVVSVLPGEVMGPEGFQLLLTLTEVHVPRMWVEQHPNKDSQACMLVFYPDFEVTSVATSDEVVLLLDASQSMKGEFLNAARMIALQVLKTLDHKIKVNVIFFGTDHTDAFLSARPLDEARQEAKNFIKRFPSAGGSTELWRPLRALSLLPPSSGTRNLLLLSDGHIQNSDVTLQLLREHAPNTRLFTCGLSPTADRHTLRSLAQAGGGAYEFFDSKSKHTWTAKVEAQVKRMEAPGATSVSVKWQQFNPTAAPPVQAPQQLHALFNDCHTLVFGFVPHCTKATLLGNLSGQELETMVSTSELQKTKGTFLHKLTARAIIRDFEDGSLDSHAVLHEEKKAELKSFVIELSKEFSILSQFTSFVAIEERDSEEEQGFTDIPKVIAEEDVDFLPYMSWASETDSDEEDEECSVSRGSVEMAEIMMASCDECYDDVSMVRMSEECDQEMDFEIYDDYEPHLEELTEMSVLSEESAPLLKMAASISVSPPTTSSRLFGSMKSSTKSQIIDGAICRKSVLVELADHDTFCPPPDTFEGDIKRGRAVRREQFRSLDMPLSTNMSAHVPTTLKAQSSSFLECSEPQFSVQKFKEKIVGHFVDRCARPFGQAPGSPPLFPPPPPPGRGSFSFGQAPRPPPPTLGAVRHTFGKGPPPPPPFLSSPRLPPPGMAAPPVTEENKMIGSMQEPTFLAFSSSPPVYLGYSESVLPDTEYRECLVSDDQQQTSASNSIRRVRGGARRAKRLIHADDSEVMSELSKPTLREERRLSKWPRIFSLQHPDGFWELTSELGALLNCNISHFAEDFLKKKGIASLGVKAHSEILKLLSTLLVLQLMRLEKLDVGRLLRTLFCLEDPGLGLGQFTRPEHWEQVSRAVEWARWADRLYPCVYSRLEFGLSWESSTKQLLGAETIHQCSPLTGLKLNPRPTMLLG